MLLLCLAWSAPMLSAQGNDLTAPLVAIVADGGAASHLEALLRNDGLRTRRLAPADCEPAALRLADVVVIDWPEDAALGDALPLGELDRWDRPTVFVGTGGERFARRWGLPTPGELGEYDSGARGPETWSFDPPAGARTEVFRQGHLFHFPTTLPTVLATAAERAWLVATVRHAARFVLDRPIVRRPTAAGVPLPPDEVARRERIDTAAAKLSLDVADRDTLRTMSDPKLGMASWWMLEDLIEGRPSTQPANDLQAHNNWRNWLKPRLDALVWDPWSRLWRLDQLAYWRGVPTAALSGDARADGGGRDGEALALATKVAQHYGGRALDDLATFTCRHGDVCWLWDRRAGVFRMENHHELPPGRFATPWEVSVLDTATDRELIWGGGPPPRPRVSARGAWRDLLTRVFLPALLLEPGTSLQRDPAGDSSGHRLLVVGLAVRGADPRTRHRLLVDPESGAIERIDEEQDGRVRASWLLEATTPCGPIVLPTAWRDERSRRESRFVVDELAWNPELPSGLATATERLTEPRRR